MQNMKEIQVPKGKFRSHPLLNTIREKLANLSIPPAVLFFLFNLFLIAPVLNPSLIDLGPFDEMIHINSGRDLLEGHLPNAAGHPFLALVYVIAYLPFKDSSFWIVHTATLGRLILFCLTWWSAYAVAKQFSDFAPALTTAGILLVTPLLTELFLNPSDALFSALSAFSLWQFLSYIKVKKNRHLVYTSTFLGLATLSRGDGLIVYLLFVTISILITCRSLKTVAVWGKFLAATFLPFIVIVYGYMGVYGLSTGDYQLGFSRYSYITFEHGHEALFRSEVGNATLEAAREATRVFGTPAENNFFFLNAIRRNPEPYFQRLKLILRGIPSQLLDAYGKRYGAVLFLFALRGAWELVRKRSYTILAALILWSAHMGAYLLVGFVRINYYRMPFFIIFTLASIGLFSSLTGYQNAQEKRLITMGLGALVIYGIADNKLAIFVGASIMLLGIWTIWYIMNRLEWKESILGLALALCLSLGLMIRAGYPSPGFQKFGDETIEQAHVFLMDNLEPGSRVMASEPGYPLAARMEYVGYTSELRNFESSDDLYQWLIDNDIDALRTTSWLASREPVVWAMIEELIGDGLEQGFRQDPGDLRILFVRPPDSY